MSIVYTTKEKIVQSLNESNLAPDVMLCILDMVKSEIQNIIISTQNQQLNQLQLKVNELDKSKEGEHEINNN